MPAICQGCGKVFLVPEGCGRTRIQCPDCGMLCTIPEGAVREAVRASGAFAGLESVPSLCGDAPIEADLAPASSAPVQDRRVPCRRCRRLILRQRECPDCDAADPLPAEPVFSMELDGPRLAAPAVEEEADPTPYDFSEPLGPRCPKCRKDMERGAVLCALCGFHRETRKKVARHYEPMRRAWESDRSLGQRLGWLAAAQVFHVLLACLSYPVIGSVWPFLIAWLPLMVLLGFILGTYDHIELTRDERGRVRLVKTWRAFFVPMAPATTEVRGYEGVVSGPWHDVGFLEWFVLISLLPWGVLPGLVWYYNAIHRPQFMVALAEDHGHAAVYVYRGRSAEQMNDIADALCKAASLRRLD